MVKNSTLFHWVNGFDETAFPFNHPILLDGNFEDEFLNDLLEPLIFDPGEDLVKSVLQNS